MRLEKMPQRALLIVGLTLLIGGTVSSSPLTLQDSVINESCVSCHAETVSQAMSRPNIHVPFLGRQCSVCHLDAGAARKQEKDARPRSPKAHLQIAAPEPHPVLRSPVETAIDTCYACHPHNGLGLSHPVRIFARRETRPPADLPTVEDGMITCTTCHDPHSGEGQKLLRKKIKTELCVTCHDEFMRSSPSTMFPE